MRFFMQKSNMIELFIVLIASFVVTLFLTNFVLFTTTTLFTNEVNDATSGFLWLLYANNGTSLWNGTTNLINYPYGEYLGSPIYITWLCVLGPLWLLSLVLPPIVALNVMMTLGFMGAVTASYYLIRRLVHRRFIAAIGAYAIAFAPYHIFKTPEHLTNIFIIPFIGIIAFMIAFWRRQTWMRGCGLALSAAIAAYTDGYFIFIAAVLVLSLLVALLAIDIAYRQKVRVIIGKMAKLIVVGFVAFVLMIPILLVQFSSGSEVSKDLSNSRGDIKAEVAFYASKPIDFLLPPEGGLFVGHTSWYQKLDERKNARSNPGESTLYVGYTILTLIAAGVFVGLWRRFAVRQRRMNTYPTLKAHVFIVSLVAAALIMLWMIPPVIHMFGLSLSTPMGVLIHYISLWRVPSRLFIVLHILLVIAAMISLSVLTQRLKKWKYFFVCSVVMIFIALEFFTTIKRPSFGLTNMPQTYYWLKDQQNIKSIAELPLVDWPIEVSGYYAFGQLIHNKPMVNTVLARNDVGLFNPLADLNNSETIAFLQDRGVDAILVHTRTCASVAWGTLVHVETLNYLPRSIDKDAKQLCTYLMNKDLVASDKWFVRLGSSFAKTNYLDKDDRYWSPLNSNRASVTVVDGRGKPIIDSHTGVLSFTAGAVGGYSPKKYLVRVWQEGTVIGLFDSTSGPISVTIDASKQVTIEVTAGDGVLPAAGEVGLTSISVKPQ